MNKYTPGPWKVVQNKNGTVNVVGAEDEEGFSSKVALINSSQEANARLIASAPALLEALQKAAVVVSFALDQMQGDQRLAASFVYDEIRAAIAAAKGDV